MVVCTVDRVGKLIKSNDQYDLYDCDYLPNLTLSKTVLHPSKSTNGHSHEDIDEVYFFHSGWGTIEVDGFTQDVCAGSIVQIKGGMFHRVHNSSVIEPLIFVSVFQRYER